MDRGSHQTQESKEVEMKQKAGLVPDGVRAFGIIAVIILIWTALGTAGDSFAQPIGSDQPLHFRFVGKFYDPDKDPDAGGVNAYTVSVEDKKWILDIERADALFGAAQGLSVIKKIYPPLMTFVGQKELVEKLKNPEIEGKPYTLEGYLYIKTRAFRLSKVQGPEEERESESDAKAGSSSAPPAPK
jgi:hypothetical protein